MQTWNIFEDIVSIKPRPITNWYMFPRKDGWEEDDTLENRLREVKMAKSTAVKTVGTNPGTPVI